MRREGYSLPEIAEELHYGSIADANIAINQYAGAIAASVPAATREEIRELELARLDVLQKALWPAAVYGDIQAVQAVLKVMTHRAKITGIDAVDTQVNQQMVLVVGGMEGDYVEKLKQLANG